MKTIQRSLAGLFAATVAGIFASTTVAAPYQKGDVRLQSIGPLATGPDGVLFVSDPKAASIIAIKTAAKPTDKAAGGFKVEQLNAKVAAVLGASADQVRIVDLAVDTASQTAYLSVVRGQGAGANAAVVSVRPGGKLRVLPLKDVQHAVAKLPNAPADQETGQGRRRRNQRMESITDLAFVKGRVIVAGLSNEEFSSTLRTLPFPFEGSHNGTGVRIFHGAHGRYETSSPVRTFVSYDIDGDPHILAAYTCTPLVKIPMVELKPGSSVVGETIAELGNRNRPIDMIVYRKNGRDHLLMANSSRGVMKITTEKLGNYKGITERVPGGETKGVPYETLADWTEVRQLAELDDQHALVVRGTEGDGLNLEAVRLP